eukprot:3444503-Amphidinium_carterae.1
MVSKRKQCRRQNVLEEHLQGVLKNTWRYLGVRTRTRLYVRTCEQMEEIAALRAQLNYSASHLREMMRIAEH